MWRPLSEFYFLWQVSSHVEWGFQYWLETKALGCSWTSECWHQEPHGEKTGPINAPKGFSVVDLDGLSDRQSWASVSSDEKIYFCFRTLTTNRRQLPQSRQWDQLILFPYVGTCTILFAFLHGLINIKFANKITYLLFFWNKTIDTLNKN